VKSKEYPDLTFVEPRSWRNANRDSVQLIVIHTTEGSERAASAEDGAAYDARRTDGTSTHYFHDQNSTVQCVRTEDVAHAARAQGNARGIQHELCGRAGQSDAQWDDAASVGTLQRAAKQAARDAKKWDIPVRHLTVAQVKAGAKGFCGHYDVTRAFPQDGGDHTDPGPNFPWTDFLNMVRAHLAPKPAPQPEEDDVSEADVTAALEKPRPYKLARIKDRGWAEISLVHKIDYIFEALVANGMIAADPDGVVDDSASMQARLSRIEGALSRLEHPGTPGA
jgi:N-acetyl-anhydromuramyl-L-alanine amidase AmpD